MLSGIEPGTTVKVREIKTVDGFVLDGTPQDILIKGGEVQSLTFWNKRAGTLLIEKLDSVTKTPLMGAQFKVAYADGRVVDTEGGKLSSNGIYLTDSNGQIKITSVVGTIVVTEERAPDGYVIGSNDKSQTVIVNPNDTQTLRFYNDPMCSLTIRKVDSVTGKPVPNTEFSVKDGNGNFIGRYTTGSDGTVTVSGLVPGNTIVVTETRVPNGYVLNSTPQVIVVKNGSGNVLTSGGGTSSGTSGSGSGSGNNDLTFENDPTTTLTIEKYLETETGNQPLKGVTFLVVDSSGAVVGNSNGEYVTDENGRIVINNLEPGITITARETKVPEGVVLDTTPKSIQIKVGEGQTLRFVNKQAGTLVIRKLDKVTGEPLVGVEFELTYAEGGYVDAANGHLSSKGLYTTGANGEIRISGITGTIVIKETKCLPGYTMDPATSTQTVTINPADTQTITVYNTPIGSAEIIKVDANDTSKRLANVTFEIRRMDDGLEDTVTTDKDGRVLLDLDAGDYYALETRAADGYVLDSTPTYFTVKDGQPTTVTITNKAVAGVEIIKVDEADRTKRLANVTFEIRRMDDGLVDTVTTDKDGHVLLDLAAGDYYAVETQAADGYKLDDTPHYFTVEDGTPTVVTITNKAFSGILIHKIDSSTRKGIYGVTFLLYDSKMNPVDQFTTDQNGYAYVDTLELSGKVFLRELENKGYIVDEQLKTVYVKPGETTEITWENTAITAQIQITKKSADYNPTNGLPAGTLLEGAVFEIYDKAGNLVDTIRSDSRGLAVSRPLPLERYTIREVKAPANYGVNENELTAYLEHEGQIVRFEVTNKSMMTGVSITKTGPSEIMAGQPVRYNFSGIANSSNVRLDSFYWRDTLPAEVRLNTVITGTYNFPGVYKITYRVNGGEPRTLADNLSTSKNYTLAASAVALGLASNERVTEIMFVFGQAPAGFAQVEKPALLCTAVSQIASTSFVNVADVGGVYNGTWVQAVSRWVTTVYGKPITPKLPRTGY